MKRTIRLILACAGLAVLAKPTQAQTVYELQIDSIIAFPDTVENGATVSFYMMVSIQNTPLLYQGNIFLELEYGNSFYAVDSVESAMAFLSPNYPNTIHATHRFTTENDLSIGDNVVVVWPRIGNGTNPPQVVLNPYETIVTLVEPNGIQHSGKNQRPFFYPNPANSTIGFEQDQFHEISFIEVHDAFGRMVLRSEPTVQVDVSNLPVGVYLISTISDNQMARSERLVIFH
ncbi:MAG: T9SS type A sorting domain-containing protein [Flavobacteriales bacterium]|nr:T9SS type A sorting domain-containing protein [Flavobacteriales bacterium]